MLRPKKSSIRNQKGMAVFEMLPMLILFVILTSFMAGFFGVIQTAILQSIASRNYAFETFRGRASLIYFRENRPEVANREVHYKRIQVRIHGTASDKVQSAKFFIASSRNIDLWNRAEQQGNTEENHAENVSRIERGKRWQEQGANPVWIRVAYGICINMQCGDI
ncbi:MAG: hypothetical protein AB7O96_11330 [Pseudobdellovibrionaceae bacterium]